MDNVLRTEEYKGYTIKIAYDFDPINPREDYDNFGTMVTWWGNRYTLGDEQPSESPTSWLESLACEVDPTVERRLDWWDNEGFHQHYKIVAGKTLSECFEPARKIVQERKRAIIAKALDDHVLMLPLYIYEHGGITMSTGGFSCPWDSGQAGWIYVTKEQVREEYSKQRISAKTRQRALDLLESEVKVYDWYLTGQVYGFIIEDENGDHIDSCWGFMGDDDYALREAESVVDHTVARIEREERESFQRALAVHAAQVKAWMGFTLQVFRGLK